MNESNAELPEVTRAELGLVLVLVVVACWLRRGVELSHFDEGIYWLWAAGIEPPGKEFFAPPLFPLLLRAAISFGGDAIARNVNTLVGTATIPLVWWVARRWYGPVAAISSAALATASAMHITFSRMALTDVLLTFWLVLAMALASELLSASREAAPASEPRSARRRWLMCSIGLGVVAGLALNTKYNGFLALALPGVAIVAVAVHPRLRAQSDWKAAALGWVTAVMIAVALYSPWIDHVEQTVGYSKLLAHHAGYSTGWTNWLRNLGTIFVFHIFLGGELDLVAWVVGFVCLVIQAWRGGPTRLVHAVWLVALLVLTPLYRPYPRLVLPLIAAGWIVAGAMIEALLTRIRIAGRLPPAARAAIGIAVIAAAGAFWSHHNPAVARSLDDPRNGLSTSCARLLDDAAVRSLPIGTTVASFVRPPVLVHVASERLRPVPVADLTLLDAGDRPRYLLVDFALVEDNAAARECLYHARDQLVPRASVSYIPSAAVLLDDLGRAALAWKPDGDDELSHRYQLVLFEIALGKGE